MMLAGYSKTQSWSISQDLIDLVRDFWSASRNLLALGAAMRARFGKFVLSAIFLGFAVGASPHPAAAADLGLMTSGGGGCSEIVFVCENEQQYPLCPIAVSLAGEVVTASLITVPHAAHRRL